MFFFSALINFDEISLLHYVRIIDTISYYYLTFYNKFKYKSFFFVNNFINLSRILIIGNRNKERKYKYLFFLIYSFMFKFRINFIVKKILYDLNNPVITKWNTYKFYFPYFDNSITDKKVIYKTFMSHFYLINISENSTFI